MDIVKCINYIIKFKAIFISLGKCVIHWQKACVSDKKTIYLAKDSPIEWAHYPYLEFEDWNRKKRLCTQLTIHLNRCKLFSCRKQRIENALKKFCNKFEMSFPRRVELHFFWQSR